MEKVVIVVERSKDFFDAYARDCEGVYGAGATVDEAKKNVLEAIELLKANSSDVPEILRGEYEVAYSYDVRSFLHHYSAIFTMAALERMTGIDQRQISRYASGLRRPRQAQLEKLDAAIHRLSNELSQVHFRP
jgi:predicted RNase H-like HicB family nuclease